MLSVICAFLLDILIGDPYSWPHPVKLMGRVISYEDNLARKLFKSDKSLFIAGTFIALANILITYGLVILLLKVLEPFKVLHFIVTTYLIYTSIAAKCLHIEAKKVVMALRESLESARLALSFIVGRDTKTLNSKGILKACIETVAENTSDGVIAPLFYVFLLGPAGGLAYKMGNTMDSMIGYKNEKYLYFGKAAARIDDFLNFVPARLTALLMILSSLFKYNIALGIKIILKDSRKHTSPNAGYPESAVAGLLGIELGGSSLYGGKLVEKPTIGESINEIGEETVFDTIRIMYRAEILFILTFIIGKLLLK